MLPGVEPELVFELKTKAPWGGGPVASLICLGMLPRITQLGRQTRAELCPQRGLKMWAACALPAWHVPWFRGRLRRRGHEWGLIQKRGPRPSLLQRMCRQGNRPRAMNGALISHVDPAYNPF